MECWRWKVEACGVLLSAKDEGVQVECKWSASGCSGGVWSAGAGLSDGVLLLVLECAAVRTLILLVQVVVSCELLQQGESNALTPARFTWTNLYLVPFPAETEQK
jgi:hypothetical protein